MKGNQRRSKAEGHPQYRYSDDDHRPASLNSEHYMEFEKSIPRLSNSLFFNPTTIGLSPRTRGSLARVSREPSEGGSIPAHAGEPGPTAR